MPKNWLTRDKKLKDRKNFKADNRRSVRNIPRILQKKARDIQEQKERDAKEERLNESST